MLVETIANWPKEWETKSWIKGKLEGKLEGRAENQREMLERERLLFKRMIGKRFGEGVAESDSACLKKMDNPADLEQVGEWIIDYENQRGQSKLIS